MDKPEGHRWGDWSERAARDALAPVIDKASDARAEVIQLTQILAAYEARIAGQVRTGGSGPEAPTRKTTWIC